jgi:hypothetical protein
MQSIKLAERRVSTNEQHEAERKANKKTVLQNVDHILDRKLILLVNDKSSSEWQLPSIKLMPSDMSLRNVISLFHLVSIFNIIHNVIIV